MPELREPRPRPPLTWKQVFLRAHPSVWLRRGGAGGSPTEPWASRRRTSLGLCACLWPWLKFLTQGIICVLLIQLNKKKSGAKNNYHMLIPETSRILKT